MASEADMAVLSESCDIIAITSFFIDLFPTHSPQLKSVEAIKVH